MVIVGAVVAGFVAWHPDYELDTFRTMFDDVTRQGGTVSEMPLGEGAYAYAMTQSDGVSPVGFDPCQPVKIVINPQNAPDGYADMVDTAVQHTNDAAGLNLSVVGETDDRNLSSRGPGEPVILAWADADEVPELAGDVRGLGGSTSIRQGGERRYVSGMVVIDTEGRSFDIGGRISQAVLDHELGHVVGLGHVNDPGQLMNPTPSRLSYGDGDLQGLASLGAIPCG